MSTEAVIVDVIRTPVGRGKHGGILSGVHPVDLLAGVLDALVSRNDLDPGIVDDVIGGCVSQVAEQSYNITRNAVLSAGFPETVPGTTIDRQCGSSQQAATFAAQAILARAMKARVDTFDRALTYAATAEYLRARELAAARLLRHGAQFLDVEPADLPVALVNRYLDIKRARLL